MEHFEFGKRTIKNLDFGKEVGIGLFGIWKKILDFFGTFVLQLLYIATVTDGSLAVPGVGGGKIFVYGCRNETKKGPTLVLNFFLRFFNSLNFFGVLKRTYYTHDSTTYSSSRNCFLCAR